MDPDAPITLEKACEIVFGGEITPSTLRAEARRGRLAIERIGRKDFVTLNGIAEMRRLCRIGAGAAREAAGQPAGSSSTAGGITPQAALLHKARKLLGT